MSRWFRWYEGTCEDGKFRLVARRVSCSTVTDRLPTVTDRLPTVTRNGSNGTVTVATVMGVWAVLLEDASRAPTRGAAERGLAFYCAVLDLDEDVLAAILQAMEAVDLIKVENGVITITNWKERQFESDVIDPTSAERQQRYRERNATVTRNGRQTVRNGRVTAELRPDTESESKKERKKDPFSQEGEGAQARIQDPHPALPSLEVELYARGKQILGQDAGGLITKVVKFKNGDRALALALLHTASTKQNPREYIGAILRGQVNGEPFYDPAI